MRGRGGAARRYARALLDVALERGGATPATVRRELQEALSALRSHNDLQGVLAHPAVNAERKKRIVSALWAGRTESDLVVRLLTLLVERNRTALLPEIERIFAELWNAHRGVVAAEAVTAEPLDAEGRRSLADALGRATGSEVELTTRVEPRILGGVLVKMGGRIYDGTVRGRLRALREHLTQGRV